MTTFPTDCLTVHNQERMAVGLNNLTWSASLAASAQAWAENMAVNGFRHSGKSGENIASTSYTTLVLSRLLGLWTKEKNHFIVGCIYPHCSNTTAEVGHYTQMVWHSTTQVGCGFAPGANRSYNYLCCQYYKAGNIIGQFVY